MNDWAFLHVCDLQPGSPRSYRFNPRFAENADTAYRQLGEIEDVDLLLVGGDLTRDGAIHGFECEEAKMRLGALPYPFYAIPGNMDTCNKHTSVVGATGRDDPRLNVTADQLDHFAKYFGEFPWSFVHKDVRFSGFYAAVAGSGLPHENRMWQWLEEELPSAGETKHHVMMMHYSLFIDELNEPTWDLTRQEEYRKWYFSIDEPHRLRMFDVFKRTGVEIVLSGHIHCRQPPQLVDGIRFYRCAGIAMPQAADLWSNGDTQLGFYRFYVTEEGIAETFIPLENESAAEGKYGPGGHPHPEERDYSLALEEPPEGFGRFGQGGGGASTFAEASAGRQGAGSVLALT